MKTIILALALLASPVLAEGVCVPAGQWRGAGAPLGTAAAIARLAASRAVLLGEKHATPPHQNWQAATVSAIADSGRPVVIGIEYLPRSMQPVLDQWVAGELSPEEFRVKSRWDELWKHDFNAYRPLLDLAKARKLPMVALNVDRDFIRAVGKQGFDAAAPAWPGGAPVGKPAAPEAAYVESLKAVFLQHAREAKPEAIARFVEAQTVWDRAFAEGIVNAVIAHPGATVVGVMGQGHVEHGHGTVHQLRALGLPDVVTAVPANATAPCETPADAADLVYGTG